MVPDWLQLGLLLAISFALGAAHLPGVPPAVGRFVAIVRAVLAIWLARVLLADSFGISPMAEVGISDSIKLFGCGVALLGGTLLPFQKNIAVLRRRETGWVLIGTVLGILTLFAGPHSLVISASLIGTVVLASRPKAHLSILLSLLTGVSVLIYAAGNRPVALAVAVMIMGLTVLFELARLLWPNWNRQLMTRISGILTKDEITRPLTFSNAAVGVALLIAILDAHAALVAATIGLLIPAFSAVIEREIRVGAGGAQSSSSQTSRVTAVVLATLLVLAILLPGAAGERPNIGAAALLAGSLTLLPIPLDPFLLAQIAAAATFIVI